MSGFRTHAAVTIILGGTILAAGCKSKPAPAVQPPLNSDGTTTNANGSVTAPAGTAPAQQQAGAQPIAVRNPDGSITNPDGSVTYPPGSRVANKEQAVNSPPAAPPAATPASSAAVPAPVRLTVPAGTSVVIRLNTSLAASRNEIGDRFNGVLDAPADQSRTGDFRARNSGFGRGGVFERQRSVQGSGRPRNIVNRNRT